MSPIGVELLEIERLLPASPARVFEAWTTPEQVKRWFGRPEGFEIGEVEMDLRVGGAYRIVLEDPDNRGTIVGAYQEIVQDQRLVFTFAWEDPQGVDVMDTGSTLVTLDFHEVDGGTRVELRQERLRDAATVIFHRYGWTWGFERLERLLDEERN